MLFFITPALNWLLSLLLQSKIVNHEDAKTQCFEAQHLRAKQFETAKRIELKLLIFFYY